MNLRLWGILKPLSTLLLNPYSVTIFYGCKCDEIAALDAFYGGILPHFLLWAFLMP